MRIFPLFLGAVASTAVLLPGTAHATTAPAGPSAPPVLLALPDWTIWAAVAMVLLGLLTAVLSLVTLGNRQQELSMEDRVTLYATGGGGNLPASVQSAVGPDDVFASSKAAAAAVLERNKSLQEKITLRLEAAGSELKASEWLLIHLGVLLVVTIIGVLIGSGNVLISIIFFALGALGPWLYLGRRRAKRVKAFSQQLPDTLQLMSGALSAGLSLAQSVDTIVNEGTEPMAGEFRKVLVETRLGVPLEDALEGIVQRFESKDFGWVVMAIKIQRQVGGNLAELLDTVAATIREREYMRRQVDALAAEGKISAYVLGGLPPLFAVYLALTQGDYIKPLFTEPLGILMLIGAITILAVGAFWMSKLIKVEV